MVDESGIAAVARSQLGLITHSQATAAGMSSPGVARRLASGRWRHVRRGVYAEAASVPTFAQSVLAAVLAAGTPAVASHRTAARLHQLAVGRSGAIDIATTVDHRVRQVGIHQHRWTVLPPSDIVVVAGVIPCTSVGRTLVDCVKWLPGERLADAIDDARRRRLLSMNEVEEVQRRLDQGPKTGRRKVVPLRSVVARRAGGQKAGGSKRELGVLTTLRKAKVPVPVQQYEIELAGKRRFLDFAYPSRRIALEFDGFSEHGLIRSTFDDDRARDAELALAGWLVLHFTSRTPIADLIDRVARALALREPEITKGSG